MNEYHEYKDIIQWGNHYLLSHGYVLNSRLPEIVQHTPWSLVIRFLTAKGYIYLKSTPKLLALEAVILQTFREVFHASVPIVIAHNPALHCFLMHDAGQSLRGILKQKFDKNLLYKAIDLFTLLQLDVANHVNVLLDKGVPDWRLDKIPDLYNALIAQKAILIADGLSEIEISQLEALVPTVVDLCKKLSRYAIKETFVQPDFNDNNTLVDDSLQTFTMIDLGEIAISHPFFSILNCLEQVKKHYALTEKDEQYQRIKACCLKNFMNDKVSEHVLEAFSIANVLFNVYGALSSYRLRMACDESAFTSSFQHQGRISPSLKAFIAACNISNEL